MFDVLVVDNHPLIREYLSALLGKEGYTVLTAKDGLAAIDVLRRSNPKVIFVDLVMPNIDGQTFCRILRRMPKHKSCFLVVLSATAAESTIPVKDIDANAYIAKGPFKKMGGHILDVLELAQKSDFKAVETEVRGLDDIHAREITKELLLLKRHFEVVLASMNEGILEINKDGRIVYANGAAIEITEIVEERLLASRFLDLFDQEMREDVASYLEEISAKRDERSSAGIEIRLGNRELELRVYPIRENGEKSIVLLVDITERKRFEGQLRRSQRLESIGTLAAGVAHDFNNLLTVIQGNTDIMTMNLEQTHPHYERLQEILRQVKSAKRLTGQLLGYARKGRFEVRLLDLNQLIRETAETFGRTRKEISINVQLDPGLEVFEGDAGQIEQMVLNLLLNAGDAMPGQGSLDIQTQNVNHAEISSDIFTPKAGKYVMIAVHDTGIGMDRETRERIFEPFFTTKEMGRGTGLGLASVYGAVKGHGGYIDVESEIGKGTTFRIYLPVKRSSGVQETIEQQEQTYSSPEPSAHGTVLLVDDEPAVCKVATEILHKLHFSVLASESGTEALRVFRENREAIVLVILDIVMPGMGGSQVFHELRALDPEVKILLCSGYSIQGEAERLLGMGANGFIQKPFSLHGLEKSISDILEPGGQ
ncbi:MAG: response regulator [Spirochaetaceae bacterium]|nr:MAG: response regulator [Spirochaetaceae bacterium]